jgi:tetratricopeptide (TPR) repeat protein
MNRTPTLIAYVLAAAVAVAPSLGAQGLRVAESISELETRARQDSCDASAHYNLALGYLSRRQWARADTSLERATGLDPQFARAWLARGLVWDRDDGYWTRLRRNGGPSAVHAEALRRTGYARRAFLIDPFVDTRILGSIYRIEQGDEDWLRYYGGVDFERMVSGIRAGVTGLVEGDYDRAYAGLNQAIVMMRAHMSRSDTLPEDVLFLHVLAAAGSNHVDEAIVDAQTLVDRVTKEEARDTSRVSPLNTNEYRYMLAALKQRAGRTSDAALLYHVVAEHDIGNYMAHVQLARIHESTAQWDSAIAERRAAVTANGEDHSLYLDLGALLARTGHYEEAETTLVEAQSLNPRDPRIYYRLGIVEQLLEKPAEARAAFEHFLAIAPSRYSGVVTDAQARLARIR